MGSREVEVDAELADAAEAKARALGLTLDEVITVVLRAYVAGDGGENSPRAVDSP